MADASPALEKHMEESIAKAVPVILAKFFSSGGFIAPQEPSSKNVDSSPPSNQTDGGGGGGGSWALPLGENASSQQRKILEGTEDQTPSLWDAGGYSGSAGQSKPSLKAWKQRRFSDYLTDLGRRTLRQGIPTDRHLFPHQFHQKKKSEHDHKASTSKLICKPKTSPKTWSGS